MAWPTIWRKDAADSDTSQHADAHIAAAMVDLRNAVERIKSATVRTRQLRDST